MVILSNSSRQRNSCRKLSNFLYSLLVAEQSRRLFFSGFADGQFAFRFLFLFFGLFGFCFYIVVFDIFFIEAVECLLHVAAVCGGTFGKLCSLLDHFNLLLAVLVGGAQVKGLADLCETVGLTLVDAVSAGDSANDVGMLKAAGLGCCMANGSDDAREAADRIIGDVREDGLAALIEELWFNGPRAEPSGHELGSPWGQMEAAEEKQ